MPTPTLPATGLHLPCLLTAIGLMLGGTLYPPLFTDAAGQADHGLALLLFGAMSVGFVRGVGFVPHRLPWRLLMSGWSCATLFAAALVARLA